MVATIDVILLVIYSIVLADGLFLNIVHHTNRKFRLPPGELIAWQIRGLLVYFGIGIYDEILIVTSTFHNGDCLHVNAFSAYS